VSEPSTDGRREPLVEPDRSAWEEFWLRFLATCPWLAGSEPADVFAFGDHRALADELAELVLQGTKTATTAALPAFHAVGMPLPRRGDLSIVLRGDGTPVCVIRTRDLTVCRFDEVDAAFAAAEGEGDRSLRSWREAHEQVFRREGERLGYAFGPSLEVACERFEVIWPGRD
jgi:uncharacterized protein YhfF